MSGETEGQPSGWTVDTALAFLQRQIDDLHRLQIERMETAATAVAAALVSAEKRVDKAEAAADRRFDSVNEFRQQLADQATTFMGRSESLARHTETHARIENLTERLAMEIQRINERLTDVDNRLTSRLDLMAGQREGSTETSARRRAEVSQMVAIVSVVLIGISVAVAVILAFNG
jgi:archaellum component FlaC